MIKCYKKYRKINTICIYLFLIKNLKYIEFDFKLNSLEWNNKSFWFNKAQSINTIIIKCIIIKSDIIQLFNYLLNIY